ncbi:CAP domain-containing protein [Fulvimarina manganoxydans]|uniref:CAP domain-containing protein n=1 Tax=Fulvimarina manganoxydans TaxID=937218 RepID=UPI003B5C059C
MPGASSSDDVIALVNQYRASGSTCSGTGTSWAAITALQPSANLATAAKDWTSRMRSLGRLSHGDPKARIRAACPQPGYVGENIACNPSAAGAVRRWMASRTGHCEVIMDPRFSFAGVGYAPGGICGGYWTIDFAGNC